MAPVIPIGQCESCGRSKVVWEIEIVDYEPGHHNDDRLEVFRVCWDCVPEASYLAAELTP